MLKTGLLNVSLRVMTLGSKFLLLFTLARYLSAADIGLYGLVTVSISMALYILGFDFYVFNTREILGADTRQRAVLIRDQFAFQSIGYLAVFPLLLLVFILGLLPWQCVGWFYLLLILEHLSQETYRVFITLGRPLLANFTMFLRSGLWALVAVALIIFARQSRGLETVWRMWVCGELLCLALTVHSLRHLDWRRARVAPVDWDWIRKGLRVSLPFLTGTLALVGITTFDRYFLKHYSGSHAVGVYTFYATTANSVQVIVETGVVTILLPKIVSAYQDGLREEYRSLMLRLTKGLSITVLVVSLIAVAAMYPILALVDKPVYQNHLPVFWTLLLANVVRAFANIPHYALYVRRQDTKIITSSLAGLAMAVVLYITLIPRYDIIGAAIAVTGAMAAILAMKTWFLMSRGGT